MDHTCLGKECPFIKKKFFKEERECPLFFEQYWLVGDTQQQKLLRDCIPKRMMIQSCIHQARLEGIQQVAEQQRNAFLDFGQNVLTLVNENTKLLEIKSIEEEIK